MDWLPNRITSIILSETQAPANVDLSNETASTPVYIAWPGFTAPAVVNATGYQSLNAVYKEYNSLTAGATIYFQADFKAGTTSSVILSVNDTTSWTGNQNTVVTGLSTTAWKNVTWSFTVYSNGKFNFLLIRTYGINFRSDFAGLRTPCWEP